MSRHDAPIYYCECGWAGRKPIQAECPTCPKCGRAVAPESRPAKRKSASAIAAVLVGSLPLWGCATIEESAFRRTELVFDGLVAVDMAQSSNGISHGCFREVDPLTSGVLGDKPTSTEFAAWGIASALVFHGINRLQWVQDRPRLRAAFNALAIGSRVYTVSHNHAIGMRVAGANNGCGR